MRHALASTVSGFTVPALPRVFVPRPQLIDQLDDGMSWPVLSLVGPAGSGKSTLAAHWCHQSSVPCAWVGLERDGDDPPALLLRVFEAIGHLTGVGPSADAAALGPRSDRLDPVVIDRLTDALAGSPPSVLVLDGMRPSGPVALYGDLAVALGNAPDCGVRLLALSRCTLPAQLTPLQVAGTVHFVGPSDLELQPAETATLVEAYSGRSIELDTAVELTTRLDGWLTGTVIAAMSHSGRRDVTAAELLEAASEDIEDHVVSDVVGDLPDNIARFVRRTSVVPTLTPALADRITGRDDSHDVLRSMLRHGLPIRRVPSGAGTFRYHHWFRATLDARFRREDGAAHRDALRFAGDWYAEHEQPLDAAECYALLGDWDALAGVRSLYVKDFIEVEDVQRLARVFGTVPRRVRRDDIQVGLDAARAEIMAGRIAVAFDALAATRPWMGPYQLMQADVVRSGSVGWVEEPLVALAAAESAIAACDGLGDQFPFGETPYGDGATIVTDCYRTSARSNALVACAYAGRWEDGRGHLVDLLPATATDLFPALLIRRLASRATFLALAGDVRAARAEADAGLALATECELLTHPATAELYYATGECERLAGGGADAMGALARSVELSRASGRRNLHAAAAASIASLLVGLGRPDDALETLAEHRRDARHRAPVTLAAMLAAAEARALGALGEQSRALRLLEPAPRTSATAAARVAVLLAIGNVAAAREAAERWPAESNTLSAVRKSIASSMVLDASGDTRESSRSLRSALLAADDHYLVEPFAEFGRPLGRLLRIVDQRHRDDAVADLARRVQGLIAIAAGAAPRLTHREDEVLAQLDRGLSLPAVAREMSVSLNTVKTHTKAVYRKLGARSRAEALDVWRSRNAGVVDAGSVGASA